MAFLDSVNEDTVEGGGFHSYRIQSPATPRLFEALMPNPWNNHTSSRSTCTSDSNTLSPQPFDLFRSSSPSDIVVESQSPSSRLFLRSSAYNSNEASPINFDFNRETVSSSTPNFLTDAKTEQPSWMVHQPNSIFTDPAKVSFSCWLPFHPWPLCNSQWSPFHQQ